MKHFLVVFLCACVWLTSAVAESVENTETTPEEVPSEITMSALDAVKLAGNLIDRGDYEHANQILTMMPQTNNLSVELERWFLLAQMEQHKGNYEEAVRIYRKILDDQPDLARVRFELALCYMKMGYWYRADYHLRLAMAGKDLPEDVKQMMAYYRYVIRQNKRWNVWFNFGAAPDSNINNGNGGEECIVNGWGRFCRNLTEPESVMGANLTLGAVTNLFCLTIGGGKAMQIFIPILITNIITMICICRHQLDLGISGRVGMSGWRLSVRAVGTAVKSITIHMVPK